MFFFFIELENVKSHVQPIAFHSEETSKPRISPINTYRKSYKSSRAGGTSPATPKPKKFKVPNKQKDKCVNDKVKEDGFYVGKGEVSSSIEDAWAQFKFVARHDWEKDEGYLASLNARQGECNDLETNEDSRRCGIGRALMVTCLLDEEVTKHGGLDPDTYWMRQYVVYSVWEDTEFTKKAKENCASIVAITCQPGINNPQGKPLVSICKSYINAAFRAKYELIFVEHKNGPSYSVKTTKNALMEFVPDPNKFVRELGTDWFFCKCKSTATKECLEMTSNGH